MINSKIKKNKKTGARIIYISGILFCCSLLIISCHNTTKEIDDLTGKGMSMQEDKATDVTFYYSEKGRVYAILHAKEFIRNETANPPYTDIKKGMKVEFLNDSLEITSTLTAKSARYYENDGNVIVRDSVCVVNKKGEKLNTEELVWNKKLEKFYTEKKVKITTPTNVLYGDGLEANSSFSWYKITNIRGTVSVDKSGVPK
jgi:LPS export ABC transporter protein LptC